MTTVPQEAVKRTKVAGAAGTGAVSLGSSLGRSDGSPDDAGSRVSSTMENGPDTSTTSGAGAEKRSGKATMERKAAKAVKVDDMRAHARQVSEQSFSTSMTVRA